MPASPYEDVLQDVLDNGVEKGDRTGTGTRSVPGRQITYDLSQGFPLITTKRVPLRIIAEELFWFLSGSSNIQPLLARDVHIWSEWPFKSYLLKTGKPVPKGDSAEWKEQLRAYEKCVLEDDEFAYQYGDLGPVYGVQWRQFPTRDGGTVDQIANVAALLAKDPNSRRMVVSAWSPGDLPDMALEPCHMSFQLYVAEGRLSIIVTQRSADLFLGVPFNLASYALLAHMFAHQNGLAMGKLVWNGGDVHIYNNHVEQVKEQLSRKPRELPELFFKRRPNSIFDYTFEDLALIGYSPDPPIKAPVAV